MQKEKFSKASCSINFTEKGEEIMAYKLKTKPLTKRQSFILMETLRNDTSLKGNEIMELRRKLKEKKLMKGKDYN